MMSKSILRLLVERHAENKGTNLTQIARDMSMSLSTLTRMLGIPMEALYGLLP